MAFVKVDLDKLNDCIVSLGEIEEDISGSLKKFSGARELKVDTKSSSIVAYGMKVILDEFGNPVYDEYGHPKKTSYLKYDYTRQANAYNNAAQDVYNLSNSIKKEVSDSISKVVEALKEILKKLNDFDTQDGLDLSSYLGENAGFNYEFLKHNPGSYGSSGTYSNQDKLVDYLYYYFDNKNDMEGLDILNRFIGEGGDINKIYDQYKDDMNFLSDLNHNSILFGAMGVVGEGIGDFFTDGNTHRDDGPINYDIDEVIELLPDFVIEAGKKKHDECIKGAGVGIIGKFGEKIIDKIEEAITDRDDVSSSDITDSISKNSIGSIVGSAGLAIKTASSKAEEKTGNKTGASTGTVGKKVGSTETSKPAPQQSKPTPQQSKPAPKPTTPNPGGNINTPKPEEPPKNNYVTEVEKPVEPPKQENVETTIPEKEGSNETNASIDISDNKQEHSPSNETGHESTETPKSDNKTLSDKLGDNLDSILSDNKGTVGAGVGAAGLVGSSILGGGGVASVPTPTPLPGVTPGLGSGANNSIIPDANVNMPSILGGVTNNENQIINNKPSTVYGDSKEIIQSKDDGKTFGKGNGNYNYGTSKKDDDNNKALEEKVEVQEQGLVSGEVLEWTEEEKKARKIATGVTASSLLLDLALKSLNIISIVSFILVLILIILLYTSFRYVSKKKGKRELEIV